MTWDERTITYGLFVSVLITLIVVGVQMSKQAAAEALQRGQEIGYQKGTQECDERLSVQHTRTLDLFRIKINKLMTEMEQEYQPPPPGETNDIRM